MNRFRFTQKRSELKMTQLYGTNRVLEPQHVLPTSAWRLDNNRIISSEEIKVAIKTIHLETTSYKQICVESNNNEEKMKQKIMDIVIRRGKLHNPVTDTGGLFYGVVEEIGKDYDNKKGWKVEMRLSAMHPLHQFPFIFPE